MFEDGALDQFLELNPSLENLLNTCDDLEAKEAKEASDAIKASLLKLLAKRKQKSFRSLRKRVEDGVGRRRYSTVKPTSLDKWFQSLSLEYVVADSFSPQDEDEEKRFSAKDFFYE